MTTALWMSKNIGGDIRPNYYYYYYIVIIIIVIIIIVIIIVVVVVVAVVVAVVANNSLRSLILTKLCFIAAACVKQVMMLAMKQLWYIWLVL